MTDYEKARRLLHRVTGVDAVFCTLAGIALLAAPNVIGAFIGPAVPTALMLGLGAVLLAYAALLDVLVFGRGVPVSVGRLMVAGDALWVIGSIVLLIGFPSWFAAGGVWLVALVAVVVADFALVKGWAVSRMVKASARAEQPAALHPAA